MTAFSADWLHLREPFDHAAREAAAPALHARLARWRQQTAVGPLAVLDLGCGHGANLRALAPRLGGAQHWRLIDHDPALLAAVPQALGHWARRHDYRFKLDAGAGDDQPIDIIGPDFHARVVRQRVDLARELASLDLGQASLVSACALLDLASASWLRRLIRQAGLARAALWFGLIVDGRTTWAPADPRDELVHALFSRHQRRDKGFGPALGPQAVAFAMQQMADAGYETLQARTDWVIDGARSPAMLLAMVEGMAAAALEQEAPARAEVMAWKGRRVAGIGASGLRVGHLDLLATPG